MSFVSALLTQFHRRNRTTDDDEGANVGVLVLLVRLARFRDRNERQWDQKWQNWYFFENFELT